MNRCLPFLLFVFLGVSVFAVERAPRITDREIIEALEKLKAGQQISDERFDLIDKRFEQIDKRFEQIDKRFEQIDKKFELVDQRFVQLENRMATEFDRLYNLIMVLFGSIVALLSTMILLIFWDRHSQMEKTVAKSVKEVEKGKVMVPVLESLKAVAKKNEEVRKILSQAHLL